jgi:hypothetical protein
MPVTARTLTARSRRFMQDWGDSEDKLTLAAALGDTTITVADSSLYGKGWVFQIEDEALQVNGIASATVVNVRRGVRGTTAAAHANSSAVQVRPHFLNLDYLEALNSAVEACYPWIYKPVVDETIVTVGNTYEYAIPVVDGLPIRALTRVYYRDPGSFSWLKVMKWDVVRSGATAKIKLGIDLSPASLRLIGFTQIQPFANLDAALDAAFPPGAEDALVFYAAQYLLASGESRRVREDTGLRDDRESRNAAGSSGRISDQIYQRFLGRLGSSAMQPMPRYVVSVA